MATYGPGIDQSQHTKSVSHIIKSFILVYCSKFCSASSLDTYNIDTNMIN